MTRENEISTGKLGSSILLRTSSENS